MLGAPRGDWRDRVYGGESRSRFRFDFQRAQQGPGSEQQIVTVFTVMNVSENQKVQVQHPFLVLIMSPVLMMRALSP